MFPADTALIVVCVSDAVIDMKREKLSLEIQNLIFSFIALWEVVIFPFILVVFKSETNRVNLAIIYIIHWITFGIVVMYFFERGLRD